MYDDNGWRQWKTHAKPLIPIFHEEIAVGKVVPREISILRASLSLLSLKGGGKDIGATRSFVTVQSFAWISWIHVRFKFPRDSLPRLKREEGKHETEV